jgi:hypothetical protein
MARKYDQDTYSLTTFDAKGAKLAKIALGNTGLVVAKNIGYQMITQGDIASFVVERVLHNSMDHSERWLPKGTGRFSDGKPYGQED